MGDSSWYGIANTSGGTTAYDDAGFILGTINYGFATSAPILDEVVVGSGGGGAVAVGSGHNQAAGAGDDFIWSSNSTTTHSGASGNSGPDWYNGFVVSGLPASGATAVTLSL